MPTIDPTAQRLTALVQRAAADGRFGFFERRAITREWIDAIGTAPTVASVDAYGEVVRTGVGLKRWGLHDLTNSKTWESTQRAADQRKLQLTASAQLERIEQLPVSRALRDAIADIARSGAASGDQRDAVRDAYLAELSACSTVASIGELYWTTYDVLKDYRRTGGGHDAWWCTEADQAMRSRSVERQMRLDPTLRLNAYNDAPRRVAPQGPVEWR